MSGERGLRKQGICGIDIPGAEAEGIEEFESELHSSNDLAEDEFDGVHGDNGEDVVGNGVADAVYAKEGDAEATAPTGSDICKQAPVITMRSPADPTPKERMGNEAII